MSDAVTDLSQIHNRIFESPTGTFNKHITI